jgi:chromosome segregation ATPase
MFAGALVCLGLLGTSACVRSAPLDSSPNAAAERARAAALERELGETRRELALKNAGLEQATVSLAVLYRRIDELRQLNAEIVSRLQTSKQSVELLAAEEGRLAAELQAAKSQVTDEARVRDATTPDPAEESDPYASLPETGDERDASNEEAVKELATLEP